MRKGACQQKDLAAKINGYTLQQFNREKATWLKSGQCTWFVQGNVKLEDANELCEQINGILNLKRVSLAKMAESGTVQLQEGVCTVY